MIETRRLISPDKPAIGGGDQFWLYLLWAEIYESSFSWLTLFCLTSNNQNFPLDCSKSALVTYGSLNSSLFYSLLVKTILTFNSLSDNLKNSLLKLTTLQQFFPLAKTTVIKWRPSSCRTTRSSPHLTTRTKLKQPSLFQEDSGTRTPYDASTTSRRAVALLK